MDYACFVGIVTCDSVVFVVDIFGGTVSRFCDSGCAFATAEYFYTAMIYCYRLRSFRELEKRQAVELLGLSLDIWVWVLQFCF